MSYEFGSDRFNRFDVYWIQTNRKSKKSTDRFRIFKHTNKHGMREWRIYEDGRYEKMEGK